LAGWCTKKPACNVGFFRLDVCEQVRLGKDISDGLLIPDTAVQAIQALTLNANLLQQSTQPTVATRSAKRTTSIE